MHRSFSAHLRRTAKAQQRCKVFRSFSGGSEQYPALLSWAGLPLPWTPRTRASGVRWRRLPGGRGTWSVVLPSERIDLLEVAVS
eukprot:12508265-Alexandrium_andersonii.AAC.1